MFRFQSLDIWKRSTKVSLPLFQIANYLEQNKKFRFAEQLRSAVLSITNNIAEGSGSQSNKEFQRFLNYSRRSIFESEDIQYSKVEDLIVELDEISRMIIGFSKSLLFSLFTLCFTLYAQY